MSNSRKILAVTAVACAVAGAGVWSLRERAKRGALGQVIPSNFILRSAEDMASLRAVLEDEACWTDLASLAERLELARVSTTTETLPAEGGEPPEGFRRLRHAFDFSAPGSVSSRVYRVECAVPAGADGGAPPAVVRAGFRSDFARRASPVLAGRVPLKVFRAALGDPAVTRDLAGALLESGIGFCQVRYDGPGPVPGLSRYRFAVGDGDPPSAVELVYRAEYDEVEDAVRFFPAP